MKGVTKEWALTMAFCVLTLLALGFGLTWVNIERVDMAYELKRLQTEIESQEALLSKLEVERNSLLTPDRLRALAAQYGLTQARPGQIRRLSAAGEEMPSPVLKGCPLPEKAQKKADAAAAAAAAKAKDQGKGGKGGKSDVKGLAAQAGSGGKGAAASAPGVAGEDPGEEGGEAAVVERISPKAAKADKTAKADSLPAEGRKRTPVPYDGGTGQDRAKAAPVGDGASGAGKAAL